MSMKKTRTAKKQGLDEEDGDDKFVENNQKKDGDDGDGKLSNTIIQQINGFSMTPMNDKIAAQTIEDHKYLLELVENRAAISYFAVHNRNQALFNALKNYVKKEVDDEEDEERENRKAMRKKKNQKTTKSQNKQEIEKKFMDVTFKKMVLEFDFMSLVMYPELKNRREFVHSAWFIAKITENTELKIAVSNDPFFYITREDILRLLTTKDDKMIQHMLKNEIMLHIQEDISYKLVKIKNGQVNANQQTVVKLVDFISVLVVNKREGKFGDGKIIFSHNDITEFLSNHSEFMDATQAIKIFIMSRKFRLALQYLTELDVEFEIDFFTFAIEANAYDIAFYLRMRYEEQLFQHATRAIDAHVSSYQQNQKFLKAKLHLSKTLLPIFNFNGVKEYLSILQQKIPDPSIENNLFSHSANPLLNMCLMYEFLFLLTKRFFSLSYQCKTLQDEVKRMIIEYTESVDDENFLTKVMLEKDYSGRDSLQIAVELEVLDLIQSPKVEAIIKRILNSDYDTSGSFFEMSTPFQIINQQTIENDKEEQNRFYKKRDIEGMPQYDSNFYIFQKSMNSRLKGMAVISLMFAIVSCYYYEQVISQALFLRPSYVTMQTYTSKLYVSNNEQEIALLLNSVEKLNGEMSSYVMDMTQAFKLISVLCWFNMMYFMSQVLQIVFLTKIGRQYTFPTISIFTDIVLFGTSLFNIYWTYTGILSNLIEGLDQKSLNDREFDNIQRNIDFKFEYLYAVNICCLLWRLIELIQFHAEIGPLVKIVEKMFGDFMNFVILYFILVFMFAIVGGVNFVFEIQDFQGLFKSCLHVLDTSIGNYDFKMYETIDNYWLTIFGQCYTITVVVTFNILVLNLIIAILSNTYQMFDTKSTGLFLSKILQSRDEMRFDENYGSFLLTMTPLNCIVLPFVPYALIKKPTAEMNKFIMVLQYSVFIVICYIFFFIGSVLMIPFAYLKCLTTKVQKINKAQTVLKKIVELVKFIFYMIIGMPILVLDSGSDFYYFWANNFRSNLKQIIIVRKESNISLHSIRFLTAFCHQYNEEKIKAIYCKNTVTQIRNTYLIKENIQYLLFGQFCNEGGSMQNAGTAKLKSTKTQNLKEYTSQVKQLADASQQQQKSKDQILQFKEIKNVLLNLSFNDSGKKTLNVDIIENVMDELRRERKTAMVLADDDIEEYIRLDLIEGEKTDKKDRSLHLNTVLEKKERFNTDLCQTVSILKLGYMWRVLQLVHGGKATILGAEAYMLRVKKIEKQKNTQTGVKGNMMKGMSQVMSQGYKGTGNSSAMNILAGKNDKDIKDPLLLDIDNYMTELVKKIHSAGASNMKSFIKIYKDNQDKLLTSHNVADDESDVEQQLQAIEKQRQMI